MVYPHIERSVASSKELGKSKGASQVEKSLAYVLSTHRKELRKFKSTSQFERSFTVFSVYIPIYNRPERGVQARTHDVAHGCAGGESCHFALFGRLMPHCERHA